MGHFATGVTVVTGAGEEGRAYGLTANSVSSVSLEPPLVLVCIDKDSASHDPILDTGVFAINILGAEDGWLARRFSGKGRSDRFRGVEHRREATGSPILEDALAWLDCSLWRTYEGGDHTIVVGRVVACAAARGSPLIFYRGRYRERTP